MKKTQLPPSELRAKEEVHPQIDNQRNYTNDQAQIDTYERYLKSGIKAAQQIFKYFVASPYTGSQPISFMEDVSSCTQVHRTVFGIEDWYPVDSSKIMMSSNVTSLGLISKLIGADFPFEDLMSFENDKGEVFLSRQITSCWVGYYNPEYEINYDVFSADLIRSPYLAARPSVVYSDVTKLVIDHQEPKVIEEWLNMLDSYYQESSHAPYRPFIWLGREFNPSSTDRGVIIDLSFDFLIDESIRKSEIQKTLLRLLVTPEIVFKNILLNSFERRDEDEALRLFEYFKTRLNRIKSQIEYRKRNSGENIFSDSFANVNLERELSYHVHDLGNLQTHNGMLRYTAEYQILKKEILLNAMRLEIPQLARLTESLDLTLNAEGLEKEKIKLFRQYLKNELRRFTCLIEEQGFVFLIPFIRDERTLELQDELKYFVIMMDRVVKADQEISHINIFDLSWIDFRLAEALIQACRKHEANFFGEIVAYWILQKSMTLNEENFNRLLRDDISFGETSFIWGLFNKFDQLCDVLVNIPSLRARLTLVDCAILQGKKELYGLINALHFYNFKIGSKETIDLFYKEAVSFLIGDDLDRLDFLLLSSYGVILTSLFSDKKPLITLAIELGSTKAVKMITDYRLIYEIREDIAKLMGPGSSINPLINEAEPLRLSVFKSLTLSPSKKDNKL